MKNNRKIGILTGVCILGAGIIGIGIWGYTINSNAKGSTLDKKNISQVEVTLEPTDLPSTYQYQLQVPADWKEKKIEDLPLRKYYVNKTNVATVEEFEKCWYATSVSSIVTNLYGMHASLVEEEEIKQEEGFTLVKVLVDYSPSLPEKKIGKQGKQEQHYLFMNGTDTFYDLWINTEELSEQEIHELVDSFHVS